MSNGYYYEKMVIKSDAIPPDNITKFAYTDDDFELKTLWHEYTEEELQRIEDSKKQAKLNEFIENHPYISISQDTAVCELFEMIIGNSLAGNGIIQAYVRRIKEGLIMIDDVPERIRDDVRRALEEMEVMI